MFLPIEPATGRESKGPKFESVSNEITVATYNIHAGIDAWGRRFDALDAIVSLDADVYILQECWTKEGEPGIASHVAAAIGGSFEEVTLASGRRALPHPEAPPVWHRRKAFLDGDHSLYLDSKRALRERIADSERFAHGESGTFSLAVVSRLPLSETRTVWLSSLPRDQVRRAILSTSVHVNNKSIQIFGTHMAHLSQGSPRHFRVIRQEILASLREGSDVIVGGDMNAWGPLVAAHLRPLRRAVKAKTWPSWGPHSQVDHLLYSAGVGVLNGEVIPRLESDHLPVVAKFRLEGRGHN